MPGLDITTLYQIPVRESPPKRVVSLVPSITESLMELGFGASVVGVTDYCIRPAERLLDKIRVGGTKNPDLEILQNLNPDLVIANQEENDRDVVKALVDLDIPVWLIFPKSVQDAIEVLRGLLGLFHTDRPSMQINLLQKAVDYARAATETQPVVRYFCPIWYGKENGVEWWMTFNQNTYPSDLLSLFGGVNIFKDRKRKYPLAADLGQGAPEPAGERDERYPRVTADEIIAAAPEIILLPSEPFNFGESDEQALLRAVGTTPAVKKRRVRVVEGSILMWYGVRTGKALQQLPQYFFTS